MSDVLKMTAAVAVIGALLVIAALARSGPAAEQVGSVPATSSPSPRTVAVPAAEPVPSDAASPPPGAGIAALAPPPRPAPKTRPARDSVLPAPSSSGYSGGGSAGPDRPDDDEGPAGAAVSGPAHSTSSGSAGPDGSNLESGDDGAGSAGGRNDSSGGDSGQDGDQGKDEDEDRDNDDD